MSEIGNIGTWHMLVHRKPCLISILQRPVQGFWGTGEQRQFFSGEQRLKNKGNTGNFGDFIYLFLLMQKAIKKFVL